MSESVALPQHVESDIFEIICKVQDWELNALEAVAQIREIVENHINDQWA